ncbi:hypothetical protein HALLA_19980 (plasmid) [Halostagnicola larsenii XH-48]|uniref:Uncharacterized protein n=1 Tax=Halostagnicola larsenii XH-48 TaxID=797299 RepID=W0JUB0_9EURY|nr:hypothetical protein HALLA_19980 [Halostagnicola larsenii XH-48]
MFPDTHWTVAASWGFINIRFGLDISLNPLWRLVSTVNLCVHLLNDQFSINGEFNSDLTGPIVDDQWLTDRFFVNDFPVCPLTTGILLNLNTSY